MAHRQRTKRAGKGLRRAARAAAAALGILACSAAAQRIGGPPPQIDAQVKPRTLTDRFPVKPSIEPAVSVSLDALGFSAPSINYLGALNTFVSLDFLGEDRLLLTFRVPGLLHRNLKTGEQSDERRIRAVLVLLPQGTVAAQALWAVHDRVRYLWPLSNGHFLLRDQNNLLNGDATLKLKPYLDFPGPLLWVDMDPDQQYMVTTSREPAADAAPAQGSEAGFAHDEPQSYPDEDLSAADDDADAAPKSRPDLVVRLLSRSSGRVVLLSRSRVAIHLPINSTGYLENLRSQETSWLLNFNYFTGGSKMLGQVESTCDPDDNFLSQNEILVLGCGADGGRRLIAMSTEGKALWIAQAPPTQVWPQLAVASNGSRLAWTTLDTTHAVNTYAPMDSGDIKEQSVTVFDAATGDIALVSPVSPVLDAGGNVALSPSGRRVALLNAGAIQVFDLPAAPPVPAPGP